MAEARSAVTEPRVIASEDEPAAHSAWPAWQTIALVWWRTIIRRYYRTRNSVRNGLWPTSMSNLASAFIVCLALLMMEPTLTLPITDHLWGIGSYFPKSFPRALRATILSCIVGFVFFFVLMYIRQCLLRVLLSYRGWMYEPPRCQSVKTILWGIVVKLISGYLPSLYSCQRSLPRLPVPPLNETLNKLYDSLKPLCNEEELQMIKKQGKEFERTIGPKLQRILVLKSWISQNYVTDWWEKYVYLRSRTPLAINSNYYCLDQSYWRPTSNIASRTATLIHNCLLFKRLIDREELPPFVLRGTIPVCMAQYERIFSTVRIPGDDMDNLVHFESKDSKHVIIIRKGLYYKLDTFDTAGQPLSAPTLEDQIQWIIDDADRHEAMVSSESKSIAALTTLSRAEWARIRQDHFKSGVNRESRDFVEKAIFVVTLLDDAPEDLTSCGKLALHGDGKSIWFDKSISVLVFRNARCAMNCEHSMADAPAMAHMWEFALTKEVLEKIYDEYGSCMPPVKTFKQAAVATPQRLVWDVDVALEGKIQHALASAKTNNDDLDLAIVDHDRWGKGEMKRFKVSPDAFIQLALQLAYYKDAHKFVQTYEASMTRLYLCGRTETVRSCTSEAAAFVKAMVSNDVPREEKIRLLVKASEKHQNLYRDAMNGKGIDRHLFALFVVSKGLGYESEFLTNIINRPWTLSTSQTPTNQLMSTPDPNLKTFEDKMPPGGGFGPISDDGYGVSYILPNNYKLFFHVSSKKSCATTDSKRFASLIFESMSEMKALFDVS